jgi:hypothetical protein
VGCHNMLLNSNDDIRLADFAGCSIGGSTATVNYEIQSRLPFTLNPTKKSDIFAFGSALYEIATGQVPYKDVPYRTIQNLYKRKQFPKDVDSIPHFGKIIRKCWQQSYEDFWEVVRDLKNEQIPSDPRCETRQTPTAACNDRTSPQSVCEYSSAESSSGSTEESYVQHPRRHTHHHGGGGRKGGRGQQEDSSWINKFVTWTLYGGKG